MDHASGNHYTFTFPSLLFLFFFVLKSVFMLPFNQLTKVLLTKYL